jgi:DNA-binding IclR family transcriptional regulator
VVDVVRLLSAHTDEGFTISEIARRLKLHKATCYPMLNALTANGWLSRDPSTKEYRLGPALVAVGEAAARSSPVAARARPAMLELSERFGVTCAAFARQDSGDRHATLADQVWDVRSSIPPLRIGQHIPLRAPFGAVFVAWSDDAALEHWAGHDDPRRARYTDALRAIRERGFAVELRTPSEERLRSHAADAGATPELGVAPDRADVERLVDELADEPEFLATALAADRSYAVSTIAAPVFWPDGVVRLGVALLGFGPSITGDQIAETGRQLRAATDGIAADLPSR